MKAVLLALIVLFLSYGNAYASDCATALANASSATELIAKAEGAGFKLDTNAKARITACFKKNKRKPKHG